jgi:hypothetical protein
MTGQEVIMAGIGIRPHRAAGAGARRKTNTRHSLDTLRSHLSCIEQQCARARADPETSVYPGKVSPAPGPQPQELVMTPEVILILIIVFFLLKPKSITWRL